jgi:hypothetical protein
MGMWRTTGMLPHRVITAGEGFMQKQNDAYEAAAMSPPTYARWRSDRIGGSNDCLAAWEKERCRL